MSATTGPIATLPGTRFAPPENMMCDEHSDRKAVIRIQGETDSFGCELYDLCAECFSEYRNEPLIGTCDWCKASNQILKFRRDFEEGSCGRVYEVCGECIKKQNQAIENEFEDFEYDH